MTAGVAVCAGLSGLSCSSGGTSGGEATRSAASALDPSQVLPATPTQYIVKINYIKLNWAMGPNDYPGSSYVEYEGLAVKVGNNEVDAAGCSLGTVGMNTFLRACASGAGLEGAPLSRNIPLTSPSDTVVVSITLDNIQGVAPLQTDALAGELSVVGNGAQLVGGLVSLIPTPYTEAAGAALNIVGNELGLAGSLIGARQGGTPVRCAGGLVANPTSPGGLPLDELTQTFTGQQLHDLTAAGPYEGQYKVQTNWNGGCTSNEVIDLTIDRDWSAPGLAAFAKSSDSSVVQRANGVEEFSVNPGYGGIQHDSFDPGTQTWSSEIISQSRNDNSPPLMLGGTPTMPVTAVSRLPGVLDVFSADDAGNLWWSDQPSPGAGWWTTSMGLVDPPQQPLTAVARTGYNLDLFWVSAGAIYWATWQTNIPPNPVFPLTPQLVPSFVRITPYNTVPRGATLAAVSRTADDIDLFYVGSDGGIWHGAWSWDWDRPDPNADPLEGYWGGTVVGEWSDYEQQTSASSWAFAELPYSQGKAPPGGALTATARTDQNIDVFYIGNDGGLWTSNWYTGAPAFQTFEVSSTSGLGIPGEPISAVSRQPNNIDVVYASHSALEMTSWFDTSSITLPSSWTSTRVETSVKVPPVYPVTIAAPSSWSLAIGFYDVTAARWAQSWAYPAPSFSPPVQRPSPPAAFQVIPANPTIVQNYQTEVDVVVTGNWATATDLTVSVSGLPPGVTAAVGAVASTATGLTVPVLLTAATSAPVSPGTYISITGKTSAAGTGQNGPMTQALLVPLVVAACTSAYTCASMELTCGTFVDACGRSQACGSCAASQTCSQNHCCPSGQTYNPANDDCEKATTCHTNQCICIQNGDRWSGGTCHYDP